MQALSHNLVFNHKIREGYSDVSLSRVQQKQQFVSAVFPPICKGPKIAPQLRPHDGVGSACGMQRQALRLRLDAYHGYVSSDWMLIITISCCWLME